MSECCCEASPPEFGGNLPDRECPLHGQPTPSRDESGLGEALWHALFLAEYNYDADPGAEHEERRDRARARLVAAARAEALREAADAIIPEPDNHHNAALCPYCTPDRERLVAAARAEGEQAGREAERERIARLAADWQCSDETCDDNCTGCAYAADLLAASGMEPCADFGQHPRGGHEQARRAATARGRTPDCRPFCQGGLHEVGCPVLDGGTP
jgi:hypothetical protein